MFWKRPSGGGGERRNAVPAKSEAKALEKAERLSRSSRHDEAARLCGGILEANPDSAPAMEIMATAAMAAGNPKKATQWYDKALRIDPHNTEYLVNKASILGIRGKYRAAAKCCDEALRLDPDNERAMGEKGLTLKNRGRFDEALECYERALAISPGNTLFMSNKGVALMMKGLYEEAIACYDMVISDDPRDAAVIFNKAVALGNLGRRKESLHHFRSAILIGPDGIRAMVVEGLKRIGASEEEREGVLAERGGGGGGGGGRRRGRKGWKGRQVYNARHKFSAPV